MNVVTWFKPTAEPDTLMALVCIHYGRMSRWEKMGDPGVSRKISPSIFPRKHREEIHLSGPQVKASGLLSPCQNFELPFKTLPYKGKHLLTPAGQNHKTKKQCERIHAVYHVLRMVVSCSDRFDLNMLFFGNC